MYRGKLVRKQNDIYDTYKDIKVFSESQLKKALSNPNIKDWGPLLNKIPYHLITNKKIVSRIYKTCPLALFEHLPISFKNNKKHKDLMLKIITIQGFGYNKKLPAKLKKDKDFVLKALRIYKDKDINSDNFYEHISASLKANKQVTHLAISSGTDPYHIPKKFKADADMLQTYIDYVNNRYKQHKFIKSINYFKFKDFNIVNMDLTYQYVTTLMQADPKIYKHLTIHHKNDMKLAWLAIKDDISVFKDINRDISFLKFVNKETESLKYDTKIINYILVRDPSYIEYIPINDIKRISFSKMSLSKKVQDYLYTYCCNELSNMCFDVLELAAEKALIKTNIYSSSTIKLNSKLANNWHFCKSRVLKEMDEIEKNTIGGWSPRFSPLYQNMSFDLKSDLDILFQMFSRGKEIMGGWKRIFDTLPISRIAMQRLVKNLYIAGIYDPIILPPKGRLRDYMLAKYVANGMPACEVGYPNTFVKSITPAEALIITNKHPHLFDRFSEEVQRELLEKHLNKKQINHLIKINKISSSILDWGHGLKVLGTSYAQNIDFAKMLVINWPVTHDESDFSDALKMLDFSFLKNNDAFKKFIEGNNRWCYLDSKTYKRFPAWLKNNKIFIAKLLKEDLRFYKYLDDAIQTDTKITDWVFSIVPGLSGCLKLQQFYRLDTTNLHPIARKVIYKKYLKKSKTGDVLDNALIAQKLLQPNQENQQAA